MIDYGEAIKYQRELKGVSQLKLSNLIGISSQNINRWESGKVIPNIDFCVKLADFYEISLDELIGRDDYIQEKSLSVHEKEVISLIRQLKDRSDIAEVIGFIYELINKTDNPYTPNENALHKDIATRYRA